MASRNFYAAIALLVFNIFLQSVLWIQRLLPSARLRVLNDLMESTRLSSQELQQESSYRCQELDSFHALEKEVEALKHRTFIELAHHKELCCLLRGVSYEIWTMGRRVKRLHARLVSKLEQTRRERQRIEALPIVVEVGVYDHSEEVYSKISDSPVA